MSYKLYLDDERKCPEGWVLARSYWEFKNVIDERGIPELVSFDYYLGGSKTGLDCAKYLMTQCLLNESPFPNYLVHSSNSYAAEIIAHCLKEFS